jgi:hypothetical protein
MKKTIVAGLVLLGISSLPASAGEVGLMVDKQIGTVQAVQAGNGLSGGMAGSFEAVSPTGVGVRLGYTLLNLEVLELGVIGTYHPSVHSNLVLPGLPTGTYTNQYAAIGIQADWTFLLNLHAGMEYRAEKLTASINNVTDSVDYYRPWMNAGIGLSLPLPVVKPFVRLEVAVPMTKQTGTTTSTDLIKALAPSLQVSLYGGIRF